MIQSAALVPVLAAIGAKDVLLVVFALLAIGLLSTFLFMRNKLLESIVEKTRSDFAEELLAKFRRGMESRIGGADLAAEIRKNKDFDGIPLVAVTADNDVGATFDASLFAEIVTKPVTAAKLRLTMMHLFPNAR